MTAPAALATVAVATLYRWRDASGADHVAESLTEVPAAFRKSAVAIDGRVQVESRPALQGASEDLGIRAQNAENAANLALLKAEQALFGKAFGARLHLPSVVLGAGVTLLVVLAISSLRKRPGRVLRLVLSGALAVALGAGYLTYLRSVTHLGPSGLPTTLLSSPAAIVDQARQSADAMSKSAADQQRKLDEIDRASR
jgi:hypothetical protein